MWSDKKKMNAETIADSINGMIYQLRIIRDNQKEIPCTFTHPCICDDFSESIRHLQSLETKFMEKNDDRK